MVKKLKDIKSRLLAKPNVRGAYDDIAAEYAAMRFDISAGCNIGPLPDDLVATLRQVAAEVDVDLDEPIEGDVCL